jgi:hypothetical protein
MDSNQKTNILGKAMNRCTRTGGFPRQTGGPGRKGNFMQQAQGKGQPGLAE